MDKKSFDFLELHRKQISMLTQDICFLQREMNYVLKQISNIKYLMRYKPKDIDDKTLEERN